jgi:type VI secretion system protein ImpK
MRKETADRVLPVFRLGLRIKEGQRRGDRFDLAKEHDNIRTLFRPAERTGAPGNGSAHEFLGVWYPLACWVDEIFISDPESPWKEEWKEQSIEFEFFGTRLRAVKFWEQARLAEGPGDADALEVFYLCVMLGFRGKLRDDPEHLNSWRDAVAGIINSERPSRWPEKPDEVALPPTDVPPLLARDRLPRLLLAIGAVVGINILVTMFLMVRALFSQG